MFTGTNEKDFIKVMKKLELHKMDSMSNPIRIHPSKLGIVMAAYQKLNPLPSEVITKSFMDDYESDERAMIFGHSIILDHDVPVDQFFIV